MICLIWSEKEVNFRLNIITFVISVILGKLLDVFFEFRLRFLNFELFNDTMIPVLDHLLYLNKLLSQLKFHVLRIFQIFLVFGFLQVFFHLDEFPLFLHNFKIMDCLLVLNGPICLLDVDFGGG